MPLSKKLQELVDRISRQREKLLQSVSGLSEAQLTHKAEESGWSVSDVLNHVALTDEANAKLTSNMLKRTRAGSLPPDPSPDASVIYSMDEIFGRMNAAKFQAPEFVAPHSPSPVNESLGRLKASRERMLANVEQLTEVAWKIRQAVNANGFPEVDHVELFGPPQRTGAHSRNFVLCPGKAYDRSPCGTGTCAKIACLAADGKLAPNEAWVQESIIGSTFTGSYRREGEQIIPAITGRAFVTAEGSLLLDEADPFCWGCPG